ncbi:molybdopterin-dependent oxidoreductase [Desulfitobacterium sp. AusDCA]
MANLLDKAKETMISRRKFLGLSASAAAGAALLTLPGCGLAKVNANEAMELANKEGTWIPAACWHNCGGRCLNKALVVDGVIIRQKTDDTHEDSPDYPQQRGCLRGRAQRQQVFGADRLKYPMKRKHWQPGGGDKSLRGKDEWERISWDEALTYIADELKRVQKNYGNRSILHIGGWNSEITEMSRTLGSFGGYCEYWNTNSFGSWAMTANVKKNVSHSPEKS